MKPIMAKDIRKKIEQFDPNDPRADEFIAKECEPLFLLGENAIRITTRKLARYDMDSQYLVKQLQMRGFVAQDQCEDRPCGECWVEITLPPGDE